MTWPRWGRLHQARSDPPASDQPSAGRLSAGPLPSARRPSPWLLGAWLPAAQRLQPQGLGRKLLGRALAWLRRWPRLAAAEAAHYRAIEAALVQPAPLPARPWRQRLRPVPPAPVVRQVIAGGSARRLLDPRALGAEARAFLQQHGLDLRAICANRAADPHQAAALTGAPSPAAADPAAPLGFQLGVLAAGGLAVRCPWSGRALYARRAFLAAENQPLFYRAEGTWPFYLAVGREGRGYVKLYLYLPTLETVLLLTDPYRWLGWEEIDQLRAWLIAAERPVRRSLARRAPPRVCALVDSSQFAHHLWNALSGIERLIAADALGSLDRLIVTAEPLGPLPALFPELHGVRLQRCRFPALIDTALRRHWLLLRPGGNRISEPLLERVRGLAWARLGAVGRERLQALRAAHRPVLWVTLRMENRTWVEQVPGLIAIAGWLARDYPAAALIVDGFSVPYGPPNLGAAQQARLIAAERRALAAIRAGIGERLPVYSTIGASLFTAVAAAGCADAYLAHHGSLQHKIGWFGHCPGLVHGNRMVLTDARLQEAARVARPGGPPPQYLPAALVRDRAGALPVVGNRWPDDLANYQIAAQDLYAALRPLLLS